MKFKKLFAAVSACAVSVFSMIAMGVFTSAESEIAYTGPSAGAMSTADNGREIRLNIYNDWTADKVKDIDPKGTFEKNVTVTFTVSGLGTRNCHINDDGTNGEAFKANLGGSIGTNEAYTGNPDTAINGDGQYTVTFPLTSPADTILCLYIQSNINKYNFDNEGKDIVFKVDKIVADAADTTGGTAAPTATDANGSAVTPTNADGSAAANNNTAAATTTANNGGAVAAATTTASSALGNSTQVNSSATGDNGVTSFVVVGIAAAAAAVVTQIKRKK